MVHFKKLLSKIHKEVTLNDPIYISLIILTIICMIIQIIYNKRSNVVLCITTLLLFKIPKKVNIKVSNTIESLIYIFIFSSLILGEVENYYSLFSFWDFILHTLSGFIFAAVSISFINQKNKENINIPTLIIVLLSFCFSITTGVIWEFYEFATDKLLNADMQKDKVVRNISSIKINPSNENVPVIINNIDKTIIFANNNRTITIIEGGYLDLGIIDTMKDLFANTIGALIFSILIYRYLKDKEKYRYVEIFIPQIKGKIK